MSPHLTYFLPLESSGSLIRCPIKDFKQTNTVQTIQYDLNGEIHTFQQDERDRRIHLVIEGIIPDYGIHHNANIISCKGPFQKIVNIKSIPKPLRIHPDEQNYGPTFYHVQTSEETDRELLRFEYYRYEILLPPSKSPSIILRVKWKMNHNAKKPNALPASMLPAYLAFRYDSEQKKILLMNIGRW